MSCMSRFLILFALASVLAACASRSNMDPLPLADYVNLDRFMGKWYVLGYTPTFLDKGAHNATETYVLDREEDGEVKIRTTYAFRSKSFDGKRKEFNPVGTVYNRETNAEWRMQFIWPFKAPYLILYVDDNYETTIIGTPGRDMAWIMAREPQITEERYDRLLGILRQNDFDLEKFERVPQRWE